MLNKPKSITKIYLSMIMSTNYYINCLRTRFIDQKKQKSMQNAHKFNPNEKLKNRPSSMIKKSIILLFFSIFCTTIGSPTLANNNHTPHKTSHRITHKKHKKHKHKNRRIKHLANATISHKKYITNYKKNTHSLLNRMTKHSLAMINTTQLTGARIRTQIHKKISYAQRKLVNFVAHTVNNLHYNSYQLGGGRFDTSHGIYVIDCSRFIDSILSRTYPAAYSSLVDASGANRPATLHYFHFFNGLPRNLGEPHWNKIEKIGQLLPGDILVFRYRKPRSHTKGHVMVVMDKPHVAQNGWLVRVADSAPIRHSSDTRLAHESGIGIGTLLLKPSATGKPAAYAWEMGGSWRKNVKFAMARPLKVDV